MRGSPRTASELAREPSWAAEVDADDWDPAEPVVAPVRAREIGWLPRPRPAALIIGAALAGIAFGMALGITMTGDDEDDGAAVSTSDDSHPRR